MEDFEILRGDTLREPRFTNGDQLETFDCVIANPPFSLADWGYESWASDTFGRNQFGVAPKTNGDFAWVMHMFTSMKENTGRMAIVVPHGVLFRGNVEAKIRQLLIDNGALECVIGLAENLFYGTNISACILVLRKSKQTRNKQDVLFINAEDIFTKGRAQNALNEKQADEIYQIYQTQLESPQVLEGISRWVSLAEIQENDYNLNIARYVQKPLQEESFTVDEAIQDFKQKLIDLEKAEAELEALLAKEGFEL